MAGQAQAFCLTHFDSRYSLDDKMMLEPLQYVLGALSGSLVGLTLGLFGGGGSILAVPLMVYLVGVPDPHMAIGTSAFAVAANAATSLVSHARQGTVKWRCAALYSGAGIVGALAGSTLGKAVDGRQTSRRDLVRARRPQHRTCRSLCLRSAHLSISSN